MSILKLPLRYEGSKSEQILLTLFDSGATFSCIHPDFAEKLGVKEKLRTSKLVATADADHYVEIKHRISLDFYIDEIPLSDEFMLVPNLSEEAILGVTTLQKWRIKLDFEHDKVIVDPKIAKFILKDLK
ncbi:MAG: retroviral-like aspartic protease [Phycisphaerae bacterium]|nr:retroviral-like aspartic protease [Saprospiraceae bacterium]